MTAFLRETQATTAIEYALIASLLSIAIVGALTSVGNDLNTMFFEKIVAAFP